MDNVNETLKERGKVYGDYKGGSFFRAVVMRAIIARYKEVNHGGMPDIYMVYLYDIVNKLSRLASTPDHIDTWHDIAGYAMLVEEAFKKDKEQEARQEKHDQEADDEATVIEFINLMEALTGEDSEITKMAKEAYEDWKKGK